MENDGWCMFRCVPIFIVNPAATPMEEVLLGVPAIQLWSCLRYKRCDGEITGKEHPNETPGSAGM